MFDETILLATPCWSVPSDVVNRDEDRAQRRELDHRRIVLGAVTAVKEGRPGNLAVCRSANLSDRRLSV